MMVLRLNTLMVLAVAADECMCQLFPVRGGDGQLKFAANDDGSCIAEKLFRAPRLEAGEELIVGDTNVMNPGTAGCEGRRARASAAGHARVPRGEIARPSDEFNTDPGRKSSTLTGRDTANRKSGSLGRRELPDFDRRPLRVSRRAQGWRAVSGKALS